MASSTAEPQTKDPPGQRVDENPPAEKQKKGPKAHVFVEEQDRVAGESRIVLAPINDIDGEGVQTSPQKGARAKAQEAVELALKEAGSPALSGAFRVYFLEGGYERLERTVEERPAVSWS